MIKSKVLILCENYTVGEYLWNKGQFILVTTDDIEDKVQTMILLPTDQKVVVTDRMVCPLFREPLDREIEVAAIYEDLYEKRGKQPPKVSSVVHVKEKQPEFRERVFIALCSNPAFFTPGKPELNAEILNNQLKRLCPEEGSE